MATKGDACCLPEIVEFCCVCTCKTMTVSFTRHCDQSQVVSSRPSLFPAARGAGAPEPRTLPDQRNAASAHPPTHLCPSAPKGPSALTCFPNLNSADASVAVKLALNEWFAGGGLHSKLKRLL